MSAAKPDDNDVEEEYGDDFDGEEESPKKTNAKPERSVGGTKYSFCLFEGTKELGTIEVAATAKWTDFLAAAKAKAGFEVESIKYDDEYGDQKEQDIPCKDEEDWKDVLAMMEEDAKDLKGELDVEVMKATKAAKPPTQDKAKNATDKQTAESKDNAKEEKEKKPTPPTPAPAPAPVAAASSGRAYTFLLFDGPSDDNNIGDIQFDPKSTWTEILAKLKAKLGYEVGSFKYDDEFGPEQEQDIQCASQEDWEDLLDMMEQDAEHLKGELPIEVPRASAPAQKNAHPASGQAVLTLRCFDGVDPVKDLTVTAVTKWSEVAKMLADLSGRPAAFDYDDGARDVTVSNESAWEECLKVLVKDTSLHVVLRKQSSQDQDSSSAQKAKQSARTESGSTYTAASEGEKKPQKLKGVEIPASVLQSMIKQRDEIVSACAKRYKGTNGRCAQGELAKRVRKAVLCSEDVANQIAALSQSDPTAEDGVDYSLFCRRFRYVDESESAVLHRMVDKKVQSARLTVHNNAKDYHKLLDGVQGKVNARQCEALLSDKGSELFTPEDAAAIASIPCVDTEGEIDFRVLPDVLVPVDVRMEMMRGVETRARTSLVAHVDKLMDACKALDKKGTGVLGLEMFDKAIKSMQPSLGIPHSVLFPGMLVQAGAMRDTVVDYGALSNHAAVVHESELKIIRKGRMDEVQHVRRLLLTNKKSILDELKDDNDLVKLKSLLTDVHHPWKMSQEHLALIVDDITEHKNTKDVKKYLQKMQFSDYLGELDDFADNIFKRWEELIESCRLADTDNTGSLSFPAFEKAMTDAGVDAQTIEGFNSALLKEKHTRVQYMILLEYRMRVLTWRELEILEMWRTADDQAARVAALDVCGRVTLSLLSTKMHHGSLIETSLLKTELSKHLKESQTDLVLKALPIVRAKKQEDDDEDAEWHDAHVMSALMTCNVSKDADAAALRHLLHCRKSLKSHCMSFDDAKNGRISQANFAKALHMRGLSAYLQDALLALADRTKDGSQVLYDMFLARFVLATPTELERIRLITDDGVQRTRETLIATPKKGLTAAREEPRELVRQLVEAGVCAGGAEESLIRAVRALELTMEGKSGSLRSEGLSEGLQAAYVWLEGCNAYSEKRAKEGLGAVAGSGLTKAQRIWRDKILKPRKPGVMDILAMFKGMPNSVCLSPLRSEINCGNNLPSASACRAADPCKIVLPDFVVNDSGSIVMAEIHIINAEGVPGPDEDSYEVIERRARVCMVAPKMHRFIGGVHLVPLSRKKAGRIEWVFSKKEAINPFVMRALTGAEVELYIELSALCRKKGTTTKGQAALNKGDIKELSCGYACLPLDDKLKSKAEKIGLPLFGGTPWTQTTVKKEDVKQGKGFFSRLKKKPESKLWVQVSIDRSPPETMLPASLVCSSVCLEALHQYGAMKKELIDAGKCQPFTRLVVGDEVLSAFPSIMDDTALMAMFANHWKGAVKALGSKKTKQSLNAAFRECVMQFYPLIHMDPLKLPKNIDSGDETVIAARAKVIETFFKKKKTAECLDGTVDFQYVPFKIDEIMTA